MRTHELAKGLAQLGRALRALPDMEIDDLRQLGRGADRAAASQADLGFENVPTALNMLLALGDVPKSQWLSFITEYNFPIEAKPKDSSRDIMDKILRYLQNNRDARNRLTLATNSTRSSTSPELQRALQILLKT